MKIVLCVKQVPDTSDIKWTENNTIQREGLESILNPCDVYAAEIALSIKKECPNTTVTVLSMGPNQAEKMLKKLLALGFDEAVLLSDKKFAASDTYATGRTISKAIAEKIPDFDLIICGQYAIDGDTAQTGPSIANFLNLPQITYVKELVECGENKLTFLRELEDGFEKVRIELPALICVTENSYEPTRATIGGVIEATKKEVKILGCGDIGLEPACTGLKGSPTYVSKAFRAVKKEVRCEFFENIEDFAKKFYILGGENE